MHPLSHMLTGALIGQMVLLSRYPAVHGGPITLGTLGALLPDLVDQPLKRLFQINLLHIRGWHWTVARRHAFWGILTQLAVAGAAGLAFWRAAGCG